MPQLSAGVVGGGWIVVGILSVGSMACGERSGSLRLSPLAAPGPGVDLSCWPRAAHWSLDAPVALEPSPGVDPSTLRGLSDLTRDDEGRFWTLAERSPLGATETTRELLRLDLADLSHPRVVARVPYEVPAVLDTESLASLGGGRFAVGTEFNSDAPSEPRTPADAVFVVRLEGDVARVLPEEGWSFDYRPWRMDRTRNDGVEGMCATPSFVVMVSEQRNEASTGAFAPGRLRRRAAPNESTLFQLMLSHRGGISALTCCESHGELAVLAIQRGLFHDGTSTHRLLGFRLREAAGVDVHPELDLDLEALYPPALGRLPNLEGLVAIGPDRFVMITDDSESPERHGTGAQLLVLHPTP